jgi:hypothetical protein
VENPTSSSPIPRTQPGAHRATATVTNDATAITPSASSRAPIEGAPSSSRTREANA